MPSRRSFLKGVLAAPAVLAVDPKGVVLALEEAELASRTKATLASSRLLSGIVASSGGWCAPMAPTYDFHPAGVSRLVRDSLPVVKAPRGRLTYIA